MKWSTVQLNTSLQLLGEARVNKPMAAELAMLNTLPEKLQDCIFIVQGTGLIADKIEARFVGTDGWFAARPISHTNCKDSLRKFISFPCFVLLVKYNFEVPLRDKWW